MDDSLNIDLPRPESNENEVPALVNFFPVTLPSNELFVYQVSFDPEDVVPLKEECTRLRIAIVMGLEKCEQSPLDANALMYPGGTVAYSIKQLERDEYPFTLRNGKEGTVRFTFIKNMPWDPVTPETVQIFGQVFQRAMRTVPDRVRIGKQTYDISTNKDFEWDAGRYGNVRLVPGAVARLVCTDKGPMLNIDISFRVMHCESVMQMLNRGENPRDIEKRMAVVTYSNKAFVVHQIDTSKTPNDTLEWSSKGEDNKTTYFEYLCAKYPNKVQKADLADPRQAMVVEKEKKFGNLNHYLSQYIYVSGLSDKMKQDFFFMKDVRNRIGGSPALRAWLTQELVLPDRKKAGADQFWNILNKWGFGLQARLLSLKTKVLAPPTIHFGDGTCKVPGKWEVYDRESRKSFHMAIPPQISESYVICESIQGANQEFVQQLERKARDMNIQIRPEVIETRRRDTESFLSQMQTIIERSRGGRGRTLIVVCMPDRDDKPGNLYTCIKQMTLKTSIVTQCALVKAQQKGGQGVKAQMTAVQICAKLCGIPWKVEGEGDVPTDGTMVVGIDFHHNKGAEKCSLMGLVASMDIVTMESWQTVVEMPPDEIIAETSQLTAAFAEALTQYRNFHNGRIPERVVVYRNGVGESQFLTVGKQEVAALGRELQNSCPGAQLCFALTFKNTKARIFADMGNDRYDNPAPGTVLDGSGISNRTGFYEFLLVPQSVTQGCITPIKVICLHNNITSLTSTGLQHLTFQLCHSFFNWFGTIKMPSVCEYAGRLAKFVGTHREGPPILPENLGHGFYYL
eukprot:NODE_190_length_2759_cov_96.849924_g176_i0.p1 GENE.NODE_190_length_2759_cov_96.849924_g176_i0~~NODE_190_length_2759_cov_96.849924_g176_i0.p1  ORF type:complete len:886 (+),score=222.57 NODE_190_length_2759_cov_96.849924_g176_i0:271-2658(+)